MSATFHIVLAVAVATLAVAVIGFCAWWVSSGARVRRWQRGLRRDLGRMSRRAQMLPRALFPEQISDWRWHLKWARLEQSFEARMVSHPSGRRRPSPGPSADGRGTHFDRLVDEVVPDNAGDFDGGNQ